MGVIVGSSSSFVECNTCNNKTSKIHGNDSGQRAAKNAIEDQWDISLVTGDAACPQCQQKELERARRSIVMSEQTSLDKTLQRRLEGEQGNLEMQQETLKQVYKAMPQQIQRISEATGIASDKIMQYANFVAFNNTNVKFHDIIRIIGDFYMFKENDEKGMY